MINDHKSKILIISCKFIVGLTLRVGSRFLHDPTLTASLTSKECCHVCIHVILGTWDPMGLESRVVSPNFHALNN